MPVPRCSPRSVHGGCVVASILILSFLAGCDGEKTKAQSPSAGISQRAAGGGAPGATIEKFEGVFHTSRDGTRRILNLSEREGRIKGVIGSAAIDARANGKRATGELKDPGTGVPLGTVELSLDGDQLVLAMTVVNPENGMRHTLPAVIFAAGAPAPIDVQLDSQLVARWRYPLPLDQSAGTSVDVWLILHADGSIEHGRSPGAGEATLASMATSGDDGFAGRWHTSDRILHILPLGSAEWIAFARYDVDGDKLILTYNNGSTQIYRRQ